jgi:hypothetical protein
MFRLSVPADRAIRINVEDRYGRPFQQTLSAVVEPGITPASLEFIVPPHSER